jgi:hypothetical protein
MIKHQPIIDNISGNSCIIYTAIMIKITTISQNAVTLMVGRPAQLTEEILYIILILFNLRGNQLLRIFKIAYFHEFYILITF